mgnify:CR=1 FL=1
MIVHACTIGEAVVVCRPRCEALACAVRERVFDAFGVTLVPEPVTVSIAW